MEALKAIKTITVGIFLVIALASITIVTRAAEGKSDLLTKYLQMLVGLEQKSEDPDGPTVGTTPNPHDPDSPPTQPNGNQSKAGPAPESKESANMGSGGAVSPFRSDRARPQENGTINSGWGKDGGDTGFVSPE